MSKSKYLILSATILAITAISKQAQAQYADCRPSGYDTVTCTVRTNIRINSPATYGMPIGAEGSPHCMVQASRGDNSVCDYEARRSIQYTNIESLMGGSLRQYYGAKVIAVSSRGSSNGYSALKQWQTDYSTVGMAGISNFFDIRDWNVVVGGSLSVLTLNATGSGYVSELSVILEARGNQPPPGPPNYGGGSAYLSVSVDQYMDIKLSRRGVEIVNWDRDYRTSLRNHSIDRRSSFRNIRNVMVQPNSYCRIRYSSQVGRDYNGDFILIRLTDPDRAEGHCEFSVSWN